MPRGRKKVATEEAPKKKEPKSPWTKSGVEGVSEIKITVEFSTVVIERNRQTIKSSIARISNEYGGHNSTAVEDLIEELKKQEQDKRVYCEMAGDGAVFLYARRDETDEEVIARLHQKKAELEKLQEELADV